MNTRNNFGETVDTESTYEGGPWAALALTRACASRAALLIAAFGVGFFAHYAGWL